MRAYKWIASADREVYFWLRTERASLFWSMPKGSWIERLKKESWLCYGREGHAVAAGSGCGNCRNTSAGNGKSLICRWLHTGRLSK